MIRSSVLHRAGLFALAAALWIAPKAAADHHEQKSSEQAEPAPTPAQQVIALEEMCAANADAMAARQSEKSLYERLGGEAKIHEIVTEVVRLHDQNEAIKHILEGVDHDHLIKMVSEFMVANSGGPKEYTGRSMPESHDHLQLTNADFLAAGGDVMNAMKTKGCGEAEIQEVICLFVSLRSQVVKESEREVK